MSLRLIIVERECGETSDEKISTTIYVRRWSKNKKLVDGWQATTTELESYVIWSIEGTIHPDAIRVRRISKAWKYNAWKYPGRRAKATRASSNMSTVINIRSACSMEPDHVRPRINKLAAMANNTRSVWHSVERIGLETRHIEPRHTSPSQDSRISSDKKRKNSFPRSLSLVDATTWPVFGTEMDRKVRKSKGGWRIGRYGRDNSFFRSSEKFSAREIWSQSLLKTRQSSWCEITRSDSFYTASDWDHPLRPVDPTLSLSNSLFPVILFERDKTSTFDRRVKSTFRRHAYTCAWFNVDFDRQLVERDRFSSLQHSLAIVTCSTSKL